VTQSGDSMNLAQVAQSEARIAQNCPHAMFVNGNCRDCGAPHPAKRREVNCDAVAR